MHCRRYCYVERPAENATPTAPGPAVRPARGARVYVQISNSDLELTPLVADSLATPSR